MAIRWGRDEHGPGGDPSWLGGKDRGSHGLPGSEDARRGTGGDPGRVSPDGSSDTGSDAGSDDRSDAGSGFSPDVNTDFSSDFSSDVNTDFGSDAGSGFSSDAGQDHRRGTESGAAGGWGQPSAEEMAPRFGESAGSASTGSDDDQDSPWRPGFEGVAGSGSGTGSRRSRGTGAQAGGILGTVVTLVILAILARQFGFDMWWVLLVIGVPLINRVIRLVGRSTRR